MSLTNRCGNRRGGGVMHKQIWGSWLIEEGSPLTAGPHLLAP